MTQASKVTRLETRAPRHRFRDLLADPAVGARFQKVRKYFFLRESTYDMTSRCNIRCDGCYYYEGAKQHAREEQDIEAWRRLFAAEKERGITFVVLAGAEPSLVPERLAAAHEVTGLGCVATNGTRRIPEQVGYTLHISVWGNDATSERVRSTKNLLARQMDNYAGDPRAIWVYTMSPENTGETREVAEALARRGCRMTFNMFSAPVGYTGSLRHTPESLARARQCMLDMLRDYPETVVFSPYNAVAHTHSLGLHDLYSCPYPRQNPSDSVGLGRSFRQFHADLSWDRSISCCVPDTDCADCRHYAAGSAVVTARMYRHATDPDHFRAWLDYVDTYLAVWVCGYEKGENLCEGPVAPPGHGLF